jgi:two-component system, sensor histidine kinase
MIVEVCDDGLGFPAELAGLMFDKFYRIGDELRRATPGTGLGLYIVKRLIEQSGARINAHSDGPGTGARFTITWHESSNA